MSDLEHAKDMLILAQEDLDTVRALADHPAFINRIFGFNLQQAAEKALKAWLSLIHVKYPFTHDLEKLFDLLEDHGQTIPPEFLPLADLSEFAMQKRYELTSITDPPLDRDETLRLVVLLLKHVNALVLPT